MYRCIPTEDIKYLDIIVYNYLYMDKMSPVYTARYRIFLKDLIEKITNAIPNDDEYRLIVSSLNSTAESLWYQAPELLNNTFLKILSILQQYVPLDPEEGNNPPWILTIKNIWDVACNELDNNFEVGASTNNVATPP